MHLLWIAQGGVLGLSRTECSEVLAELLCPGRALVEAKKSRHFQQSQRIILIPFLLFILQNVCFTEGGTEDQVCLYLFSFSVHGCL